MASTVSTSVTANSDPDLAPEAVLDTNVVPFDEGDGLPEMVGTPMPSSRDVEAQKHEDASSRPEKTRSAKDALTTLDEMAGDLSAADEPTAAGYEIITGYQRSTKSLQEVAVGTRSYENTRVTSRDGFGLVDATGVRVFRFAGETTTYDHPVGQAQYALHNLNSFRLTGDSAYLEIARKNGQRLVDTKVVSADAWYYPYDFDFAVHGDTSQTLEAPWYSAMAQGQALSAFVRLYEVTSDPLWKEAADRTFISLIQAPAGTAPFASRVDEQGRLFLEEYPRYPVENSEMVLNGHIYAMFGLHDYWQLTGHTQLVGDLLLGALKTVELTVLTEYRRPGWASVYSLWHEIPTFSYHQKHVEQFLVLWRMTKDPFWVTAANVYRTDFPLRTVSGSVAITPRVTTFYKLSTTHKVTSTRKVSFSRNTGAPFHIRRRIDGGPIAVRIDAGPYTDWWVEERFGFAWARGATDLHGYLPQVKLTFAGGKQYSAYRLDAAGNVVGSKTVYISRNSSAPTSYSGFVQGRPAHYLAVGAFAGYWVPLQSKVTVGAYGG